MIKTKLKLPKRIVALGASTCFGTGDPIGGGFVGRFKNWYENASEDIYFRVYNLGIPGNLVEDIENRIDEVEKRKPQLIILQVGCNDCIREGGMEVECKTDIENYIQIFNSLILKLKDIAPVIFVSSLPIDETKTKPVKWADHYYLNEDIVYYSKQAIEIAQKHELEVVDILRDWLDKDYNLLLAHDGLHPSENGHEYIFQKLRDKFYNIYKITI